MRIYNDDSTDPNQQLGDQDWDMTMAVISGIPQMLKQSDLVAINAEERIEMSLLTEEATSAGLTSSCRDMNPAMVAERRQWLPGKKP